MDKKLFQEFTDGKLHHSIMLIGQKGLGKYDIARKLAADILSVGSSLKKKTVIGLFGEEEITGQEDPVLQMMNELKHPDFLVISEELINKKHKEKSNPPPKVRILREMIIDFMSTSPFIAKNKVLIINGIDELDMKFCQNALLKTIEEPQKNTYIFLICHNINNVLATIKSRCREIVVPPPDFATWKMSVGEKGDEKLYNISNGSISYAKNIIDSDGMTIYEEIHKILSQKNLNIEQLHQLADKMNDDNLFGIFSDFIMLYLYNALKYYTTGKLDGETKDFVNKNNEKMVLAKIKQIKEILQDTDILNLFKKHAVIVCFLKLFA